MRYEPRDFDERANCFWNQDMLSVSYSVGRLLVAAELCHSMILATPAMMQKPMTQIIHKKFAWVANVKTMRQIVITTRHKVQMTMAGNGMAIY